VGEAKKAGSEGLFARALAFPIGAAEEIGETLILVGQTMRWMVSPPFRLVPLLNAFAFIGSGSMFIVCLVGLFTGMAFTVSTIVGFRQFSAEGMVGGVVAVALARELAPVLTGVVVTARAGSTIASELGNMRVTEQIDAITTMGLSPVQYLVVPRMVATTVVLPMLSLAFGMAGMLGAYVVAVVWQNIDPGIFWDKVYQFLQMPSLRMMMVKAVVFGFLLSMICCKKGFYASGGARGVGEATAKAVVSSIVVIFGADYIVTTMMTDI